MMLSKRVQYRNTTYLLPTDQWKQREVLEKRKRYISIAVITIGGWLSGWEGEGK